MLLDSLENAKLAVRKRGEGDRRQVWVSLTMCWVNDWQRVGLRSWKFGGAFLR